MASMAQPFPHPLTAHMPPGAHPMGPGHPSNHAMPGGQPGVMAQQMQAMGGPQVSQGQMINMAQGGPGMGAPNAHAMSHLTPNLLQQQYQQQQIQQVMASNPQLLQQQRQMQLQRQQQHMMQHGQANMGMNPNAQQMMMNQMNRVNMPPHLQGMQPGHPAQFMPPGQQPQQQPNQEHLRQMAAMQQQAVQAASQAGAAPGQPAQQSMQPVRPPSTMGGADPQNPAAAVAAAQHQAQQAQQQAQHQAQQQAQQQQPQPQQPPQNPAQQGPQPQVSQPTQNQQVQAQTPAQSQGTPQPSQGQQQAQPQLPQQTGQQAGQIQQQQQQQPGQQQQPNSQPPDATMQAKRQAQLTQMQQAQAMRNQAQVMALTGMQNSGSRGMMSVFKLYQFGDQLGPAMVPPQNRSPASDILYWKGFVSKFFSETGLLRQKLWNSRDHGSKEFELATPVIARFYWTQYNSRVQKIQMIMDNPTEKEMPNGGFVVESSRTSFIYWYKDDHQVVANGSLRAQFNQTGKIDLLEHSVSEFKEYVPLKTMQMESPEQKSSPNVTKSGKKAAATGQRNSKIPVIPRSVVGEWGLSDLVVQLLEIAETFSHMSALFDFARNSPDVSAPEALRQLLQQWRSNPQNNTMVDAASGFNPMLTQQPGQGTPGPNLGGQQQFASPAPGAHLNLPNTASPASRNMSPAMQAHGLQQAAVNQGVSATTSPNVNNKRRRPSGVKQEDGDNGSAEVNGPKVVKQSPRPGKRQKPPPQ